MLLVISHTISYFITEHFIVNRHNRMTMYLVANQVKLMNISEKLFSKGNRALPLSVNNGVANSAPTELYWTDNGIIPSNAHEAKYHRKMSSFASYFLGEDVFVARQDSSDGISLWINQSKNENIWIKIPIDDYQGKIPMDILVLSTMLLFLSLSGAWILVSQLHRPMKRLAFAAREVGRGDYPGKLKEEGPYEIISVTQAFNQMATNVHQLEEDRTLLLAGISHDLRTPITRIRLATEFLPDDEQGLKQGIIDDTQDMDEIIDQFIGYIRYGSEEAAEYGNLNELLEQMINTFSKQYEGIESKLNNIPKIKFRPVAMKRLLSNLIENAFRYGKEPVVIESYLQASNIIITVRDHGKGLKDLDKQRLFQPFARGEDARTGKGSGLGLAIVSRIAEMHGGEISLENHPVGGGLQAKLILPVTE